MMGPSRKILLSFVAATLAACGTASTPPAPQTVVAQVPQELLSHLVERYWDESAASGPWYSWGGAETRYAEIPADGIAPQELADALALERRYLDDLERLKRAPLDADAKLTYDLFRRERALTIESFTYPAELLPVNPYDSMPQRFALLACAAERHALDGAKDFDTWRRRALNYQGWTTQAILNLREGMRRGYTLPLAVVARTLPTLALLAEDAPTNAFYQPLRLGGASATLERTRLSVAIKDVIKEQILPAYRTLHNFLEREYLPRARSSAGLSALPLGSAWYAYIVKRGTGSAQSAAGLHALGVAEVARVRARLLNLLADTPFAGNPQGLADSLRNDSRYNYKTPDDLLAAYQAIKVQVAAATPALFSNPPRGDFEIRGIENFRTATGALLSYRRMIASGRDPAVLYVNTADLGSHPAIVDAARYLAQAVPGHHYQLAIQQENAALPRFRRFGGAPAFVDGWALYAATLGEELGVYRDLQGKFGALLAQLQCATGLVIDTGIHSQQWTRAYALEYLHAQIPLDEATAANLIDRTLALPGEALACTAGFLEIQALRNRAQQVLGSRFDVREFHAQMLKNGALPLDLLDAYISHWLEVAVKETPPAAMTEARKFE